MLTTSSDKRSIKLFARISAKSTRINHARLEKMEARNQVLQKILIDSEAQMNKRIAEDPAFYKQLLKKLILQVKA